MNCMKRFAFAIAFAGIALAGGCAAVSSPAQLAIAYRQTFNAALESIHQLHVQGGVSSDQERQLLPAILAGSAALDRLDSDASAGGQASFDVDLAAVQAALAQLRSAASPTTAPSTAPASPGSASTSQTAGG